jgi:hypothetical protein
MGARGRHHVVAHNSQAAIVDQYERMLLDVVQRGR